MNDPLVPLSEVARTLKQVRLKAFKQGEQNVLNALNVFNSVVVKSIGKRPNRKRFFKPENYDKIKDLKDGYGTLEDDLSDSPGENKEDTSNITVHDVATLALIDATIRCKTHTPDSEDGGEMAHYILHLMENPEALQKAIDNEEYEGSVFVKALDKTKLVQRRITVNRGGKSFQRLQWVKVGDDPKKERKKGQEEDTFSNPKETPSETPVDTKPAGDGDTVHGTGNSDGKSDKKPEVQENKLSVKQHLNQLVDAITKAKQEGKSVSVDAYLDFGRHVIHSSLNELRGIKDKLVKSYQEKGGVKGIYDILKEKVDSFLKHTEEKVVELNKEPDEEKLEDIPEEKPEEPKLEDIPEEPKEEPKTISDVEHPNETESQKLEDVKDGDSIKEVTYGEEKPDIEKFSQGVLDHVLKNTTVKPRESHYSKVRELYSKVTQLESDYSKRIKGTRGKKKQAIIDELSNAREEYEKAANSTEYKQVIINNREQFIKAMGESENFNIFDDELSSSDTMMTRLGDNDEGIRKSFLVGKHFIRQITSNLSLDVSVGKSSSGRAFHMSSGNGSNHSQLALNDQDDVSVHEIAHAISAHKPGVQKEIEQFIEKRCQGEEFVDMKEKFGDEFGGKTRKDQFDKVFGDTISAYYTGKIYDRTNGSNNELLSMTLQAIYNNPGHVAQADPELFKFVVGLLKK